MSVKMWKLTVWVEDEPPEYRKLFNIWEIEEEVRTALRKHLEPDPYNKYGSGIEGLLLIDVEAHDDENEEQ